MTKPRRILKLVIEGEPTPWAAPQVNLTRAIYRALDLSKRATSPNAIVKIVLGETRFYASHSARQKQVRQQIQDMLPQDWKVLEGPIGRQIRHYCSLPVSRAKLGVKHGDYKIQRPDDTNYDKFIEDCMSGIIYKDDNQLCARIGTSFKKFAKNPRTEVILYCL